MSHPETATLDNDSFFASVSGLWQGKKPPFRSAAVLRSTNFRGDALFSYEDVAILEVEEAQLISRQLRRDDIVIERSGGGPKQPVGRVALFDPPDNREYATSNFTTAIRIIDPESFDARYVSFVLHGLYLSGATESLQRTTTGIRNLDWKQYRSFEIPRLPIDAQRAIGVFLDKVRTASLIEQAQLTLVTRLKRATTRQIFTHGLRRHEQRETAIGPVPKNWDIVPLLALGRVGNGSTPKKDITEYWSGGSFPWLTSAKVYDRDIVAADRFVTDTALLKCHLPIVEPGAILIAITGQGKTLGHCAVLRMRATVSQHVAYVATDLTKANPSFIRGYLETQYDYFRQIGSGGGSTKGALTCAFLRSVPIPLPATIEEQDEIVEVLDALDRKIELHRRKRDALDDLFKALLNKLMAGEIRAADLDWLGVSAQRATETAA